jgi:hypothetical protein
LFLTMDPVVHYSSVESEIAISEVESDDQPRTRRPPVCADEILRIQLLMIFPFFVLIFVTVLTLFVLLHHTHDHRENTEEILEILRNQTLV